MEDPHWQNSSQSFGYNMPQTTMAPKNPFISTTQLSPTKSGSYRLRWHNSVAEDYSPVNENGGGSLKRSSSIALPETNVDYPRQMFPGHDMTVSQNAPQAKKRKASDTSSIVSTPVKPKQPSDGAFDTVVSASTGIQTPPPSNPTVKRRRGRPPKNPQGNPGASKLEFVNEQTVKTGSESRDTTPTKGVAPFPRSSPVLQQFDNYMPYENPSLQIENPELHAGIDFQSNKYWDASFTGSVMSENNFLTSNLATMAGEIDIVAATATFDWSVIPTSVGDMTAQGVMDPLRPLSMHTLSDNFFHGSMNADALNFSFAQDPLSASDIISPVSVDPNLLFSDRNLAKAFSDDYGDLQPYRQQNLQQQQQEKHHGLSRKQDKRGHSKSQNRTSSKVASNTASSRPVMKRALTESVLTKSASKSMTSKVTVHPSPVKQMRSFASGKTRSAVRDENTTPSPTVGSTSVKQLSPRSGATNNMGKGVRTAVNFSISPGGRAKAEKVIIQEADSQSEHSGSEDGQENYDTDSSTDEDDLGPLHPGYSATARQSSSSRHHGSSSFNGSMERPKLARFKTAPANSFSSSSQFLMSGDFTSDSFGLDNNPFIPYNLSMSSDHSKPSRRRNNQKVSGRHSRSSSFFSIKSAVTNSRPTNLDSTREEGDYSEAETVVDEPAYNGPGDAILALKQAVARRNSYYPTGGSSRRTSTYGNSRPSTRHTNILPSSPPMQQPYGLSTPQTVRSGYSTDSFNISPTTMTDPDCVTPSTYGGRHYGVRQDNSMDLRCGCSSTGSPEMPVLQCNACFKWLHVHCEGYGRKPIPPNGIVCSFCKGGWQGPQQQPQSQQIFRKPSIPQTTSPLTTRSFHS